MGSITLLWNFARKSNFYGRRQDYNSQEALWPSQGLDAKVISNKTSFPACSLRVRRTIVVLEGEGKNISQCDFYKQPCLFLLEYWSYGTKFFFFFCTCMWLNASWPTLGYLGLFHPWQCHQWVPQCGSTGFFWNVWCTPPRVPSPAVGAVRALEPGLELSTALPHPLCPSRENVETLSHCTALKWLQQNTFPVPGEVTLWDTG